MFQRDLAEFDVDLEYLGARSLSTFYIETGALFRINRIHYRDADSGRVSQQAEISVEGNTTELHIRYGTTVQQETARYIYYNHSSPLALIPDHMT